MSAAKHTPGPWRVDPRTDRIVADSMSVGKPVVLDVARTFPRRGKQETDANARLIAAAPDMKAALLPLLEVVDEEIEQRKFSGNDEYWQGLQALSDAGHAAIARAEGR